MGFILETERLALRKMTQADFPALCEILQDEQIMYAYEGAFSGEEAQHGSTGSWSAIGTTESAYGRLS